MKYRRKSEIIEAVKWNGNIETINNNKWLEDAIKDNKLILGMNYRYDKKPVLLILDKDIVKIKKEDYIIKETFNQNYKIRVMDCETFENLFEALEEKEELNNLENEFIKVKKMRETRKIFINNEKYTNSFKVVTKDMFIKDNIGFMNIDSINKKWNKISKGYNFVLFKQDINNKIKHYYSVDAFNEIFKR